ncbi:MAG: hypothetical protein J0I77_05470 [Rudaea sp.]|uniref:cupin domain-containing protein n=1 Tax=unclassified Rudaea TaxID=2627037 RepID=UPI0010F6FD25|nr:MULTISPECIES: cupin domain-containing protein [unclassified Rudaea]MBN8885148.1 hypothetical protein [Rudaea sp.]MBR0345755.1 hypothetical protein [Rudaea sp.]
MNLAELLHPVPTSQFLHEFFGVQPILLRGTATKIVASLADGDAAIASLCLNLAYDLDVPVSPHVPTTPWPWREPVRCRKDLFVLGCAGDVQWRVHGSDSKTSDSPTWEATLSVGDALYLPRGSWCSAESADATPAPRLLEIHNPTGTELLHWLVEELAAQELVTADVPRFGDPAAKADYLIDLRRKVAEAFRVASLLERFAVWQNQRALLATSSPEAIVDLDTLPTPAHRIEIALPRKPRIYRRLDGKIAFKSQAREYSFLASAMPVLRYLLDHAPLTVAEAIRGLSADFDSDEILAFLSTLQRNGVIRLIAAEQES